jgi:hypothetical protein
MENLDWENEGFRLGTSLDFVHAIVVTGDDPDATAGVALGIARAQVGRRRVAIGDLLGESARLQALVEGDDPHGLSDSFTYGVSLNRIARPARGIPALFILPSGSEEIEYSSVLRSDRWARLAAGFREVDSLLILAAPAWADGIQELVALTEGAVAVGHGSAGALSGRVLARIAPPQRAAAPRGFASAPVTERRQFGPAAIGGMAAAALLVLIGGWLALRPLDRSFSRGPAVPGDTTGTAAPLSTPAATIVAASGDSLLAPANPGDSGDAASFAVELKRANTQAGAILLLEEERGVLPAATFSPEIVAGGEWFTIVGGAFADSTEADSLLKHLRDRGALEGTSGGVSRRPYAFVLHGSVRPESANSLAAEQRRNGIPAYALRQADGTAVVYAGAFSSPDQAMRLAAILRAAGIAPTLVYRTGRIF